MRVLGVVLSGVLIGCGGSGGQAEVGARLEALEARVDRLEGMGAGSGGQKSAKGEKPDRSASTVAPGEAVSENGAPLPEGEEGAKVLFREARRHARLMESEEALQRLATLQAHFAETETAKRAGRLRRDLKTVGTSVEALNVSTWFQGDDSKVDIANGKTILIFADVTEGDPEGRIKQFNISVNEYRESVSVVALLRGGDSMSKADATTFATTHGMQAPVGKLTKRIKDNFGVRGTPSAAVVVGGTVAWKGMLTELDENVFERLL